MLYFRAVSKYNPPGAYIRSSDLTEGFLRDEFKGPIHGGVYFWNFTVIMKAGDSNPHILYLLD